MNGTSIDNLRSIQNNNFSSQVQMPPIKEQYENIEISKLKDDFDIEELTKDINESIHDETFVTSTEMEEDKSSYIPFGWKEPLLLLFIYLLLSQALVKQFLGKYIPQLNPGGDGTVGFLGVLIYGILLVTIYFISKTFLI